VRAAISAGTLSAVGDADHRARRRGADDKAAVALANTGDARNFLDIDDQIRLDAAGAELNQQIRPAGQDLRGAGGFGQNTRDRRISGLAVHEHVHVRIRSLRHPERACGRLRRGLQPPEGRGLSRAGLADRRLRGGERA